MPYLQVRPTFDAGSWFTEESANIELIMDQLLDVCKVTSPTLQIFLNHAKPIEFGPDEKIGWNLLTEMYNPKILHDNQVFVASDIDPITRMEFEIVKWYSAASTNRAEMVEYGRANRSRLDLVDEKAHLMNKGLTWMMNYRFFSNWAEPIAGDGTLDIEAALSAAPVPPSLKEEGLSAQTERYYSLPMVIRGHHNGHTFGNLSSENKFWRSTETIGGAVSYAAAGTPNADAVISIDSTVELGISDIRTHLAKVQYGGGYTFYAACPADLYTVLEEYLMADRRAGSGVPIEEMNDLGIDAAFTYKAYNTTFYVDPMMTWLYPNSVFFYDPDVVFMVYDPEFFPWLIPFERIPNTSTYATAASYHGQIVCLDRLGCHAMHAYAPE